MGTIYYFSGGLKSPWDKSLVSKRPSQAHEVKKNAYQFKATAKGGKGDAILPISLPKVLEKVQFLESNTRPDAPMGKNVLVLRLPGGLDKKKVLEGEKIYIRCTTQDSIEQSMSESPCWIESKILDEEHIKAEFHMQYVDQEGKLVFHGVSRKILTKEPLANSKERAHSEAFLKVASCLKNAKIYPSDKLIDLFGGESFKEIKSLCRLDFNEKGRTFFIKEGMTLVFENDAFVEQEVTVNKPLLLFKKIDKQRCECVLWNESGLFSLHFVLPIEKPLSIAYKPNELAIQIHQRSDTSVICSMNHRNMILQKGDWLIKSKGLWRHLYSPQEIKDCLRYAIKGELFIFEGVEKKDNNYIFTGHLFDEKRTSMQKVEIPFQSTKFQGKEKGKKGPLKV